MIIYNQSIIDFLKSVKAGSANASITDQSLIDEAKSLNCITVHGDLIELTARGEVVRRMTYYYPREEYISSGLLGLLMALSFIIWLILTLAVLAKEISIGSALFGYLAVFIPLAIIWVFYVGVEKPTRRVQIIGPSDT